MAVAGTGRPPVRDRRADEGRVPRVEPQAVRRRSPRAGRAGDPVPTTHRRGAGGDHPPRPPAGPGRPPPRPDRNRAEDRTEDGTLHRDGPDDPEDLRPGPPGPGDLPAVDRPPRRDGQGQDLPPLRRRPGRLGREPRRPVRPDAVEHLPDPQRDARPAHPGDEARVHAAPELRRPEGEGRDPRRDAPAGRRQGPAADQGPQGPAPLPGEPLRGPAPLPRAGGPPVPQDELPEVPAPTPSARRSTRPRPRPPTSTRSSALQEEALAVKNQIIRANLRLVVSIAKRHVGPSNNFFELVSDGNMSPDPRRREVRLRPRQQVLAPTPRGRS